MQKEYIDISELKKIPILTETDNSYIFKMKDYILKIYKPAYIQDIRLINMDIERKILSAKKIETIPEIEVPVSALYDIDTGIFLGAKYHYIKGLSYVDYIEKNARKYKKIVKYYDLFEDIFKRAEKESIVFPDFSNYGNLILSNNKLSKRKLTLIDYEGIQIANHPATDVSKLLIPFSPHKTKLIFTPKYINKLFFTQELNIYSEYALFFADLLNISISEFGIGGAYENRTIEDFFRIIGLKDYDIQNKIWKLFQQNEKNEFLGDDKYKLLEEYNIMSIKRTDIKRLVKKR